MKIYLPVFFIITLLVPAPSPSNAAVLSIQRPDRPAVATYDYRATTREKVGKSGVVTSGDRIWQCGGTQCTSRGPWPIPDVVSCQSLAGQVGEITSYGYAGKQLNPNQLSQCNSAVRAVTPITPTPRLSSENTPSRVKSPVQPALPGSVPLPAPMQQRPGSGFPGVPPVDSGFTRSMPDNQGPGIVGGGFAAGVTQPSHIPKIATMGTLTVKGASFSPKVANVPGLTVRGASFSPKVASVSILTVKGAAFSPKNATTDKLTVKGAIFSLKTATVAILTVKGQTFAPRTATTDLLTVKGIKKRSLTIPGN